MNLLDALESIKREDEQEVPVTFSSGGATVQVNIKIYKVHGSTYATSPHLLLTGGSQDINPERAKVKAILRLYTKIILKLIACKKANNYESLFFKKADEEEVDEEMKQAFIAFSKNNNFSMYEGEKIPVISEIVNQDKEHSNIFHCNMSRKNEVSDLSHVQESVSEKFNKQPEQSCSATKTTVTIPENSSRSAPVVLHSSSIS